jgi:hypothetical protein
VSERTRRVAGDVIMTTLSKVGKHVSERARGPAELGAAADAMADWFCAYLRELARG